METAANGSFKGCKISEEFSSVLASFVCSEEDDFTGGDSKDVLIVVSEGAIGGDSGNEDCCFRNESLDAVVGSVSADSVSADSVSADSVSADFVVTDSVVEFDVDRRCISIEADSDSVGIA